MQVILPKERVSLRPWPNTSLFYLGGPSLGGANWQWAVCQILTESVPDCIIATPSCRLHDPDDHAIKRFALPSDGPAFPRQLDWERHYMTRAARPDDHGCLLFWLPEQRAPRTDGNPYAMDSYGELGEWRRELAYTPHLHLVVGAEPNFPGRSQIARNLDANCPRFVVHSTLIATIHAAVAFAPPEAETSEQATPGVHA